MDVVALQQVVNIAASKVAVEKSRAQAAEGLLAPISFPTFTGTVSGISATMVGLGSVANTSDSDKPVSTAQQTALDAKATAANLATETNRATTAEGLLAPKASPTFTGTVAGVTSAMVGLGSVNNTADVDKPVSTATATSISNEVTRATNAEGALSTQAASFSKTVIVRDRTSAETTDTAAFNDALTAAGLIAGTTGMAKVTWQPGRAITSTGGHLRPLGVSVDFSGNTVTHTGNNIFLDCHATSFEFKKPCGIRNLILIGNSGTSAVGLELGNSYGFILDSLVIGSYSGGVGIDMRNRLNWCEGTTTSNILLQYNLVGLRLSGAGTTDTANGATNSFGYSRLDGLAINVLAGGIGILIGPDGIGGGEAYLYNSTLSATIWLDKANATGIVAGLKANALNLKVEIVGEGSAAGGSYGFKNLGGNFRAYGHINIIGALPNDLSAGLTLSDPEPFAPNGIYPPGTDSTLGGALSLVAGGGTAGTLGTGKGSNLAFAFASGYDATAADLFRIYAMPYSTTNLAIGTSARRQFGFDASGVITMGVGSTAGSRLSIVPRAGTPESASSQGAGSLALRSDGHVNGYNTVYIKTTARNTTTGWMPIQPIVSGTTANRPASPTVGWFYFDTTLNKPIWRGNTAWVDATGTAV